MVCLCLLLVLDICNNFSLIVLLLPLLCTNSLLTTNLCVVNCIMGADAKYRICLDVYVYLVQKLG
jgi:hypothetical protein